MRKTFWTATAAVALVAAMTVPAMAQDPQGRGAGRGQGMGMGMGPGRPGGPGGVGPIGMLRGVQLTEVQREQIRAIHEEASASAAEPRQGMQLQRELHLALLADTPDQQKIASLKQAIAEAQAQGLARRIEVQGRVAQVLTPEQRAQVRERLAQAPTAPRGPARGQGRGAGRR
jgi:periplasmic protein CpxP/Spy